MRPEITEEHQALARAAPLTKRKTDIPLRMSAIWGRAEVRGDAAEPPFSVNSGSRDAGRGSRQQHKIVSHALPKEVADWWLTIGREMLVKFGTNVTGNGHHVMALAARIAVSCRRQILAR